MLDEIVSCLRSWSQGTSVSVVVIGGEGPAFCSGLDRDWIGSDSEDDRRAIQFASSAFHRGLFGLRIPTIAMIHGFALGTGMDIAVLCDMRVASDDAVFGHPEIFQGGPPLFTPLRSVIGDGWARELCLTGRLISAEEGSRIGLLNNVVAHSQLQVATRELAEQVTVLRGLRSSPPSPSSASIPAWTTSSIVNTTNSLTPGLFFATRPGPLTTVPLPDDEEKLATFEPDCQGGFRMVAGVRGIDPLSVRIGLPVRLIYYDTTQDWTLFGFESE